MTFCKYFLEGTCRFGNKCKFSHAYYDKGYSAGNNYFPSNSHGYVDGYNRSRSQNTKDYSNSGVSILRANAGGKPFPSQTGSYSAPNDAYHVNNQKVQESLTLQQEIACAEAGGQWPLSCWGPLKESVNVPGLVDHSPEELRWEIYRSSKDGTFEQCKLSIQQLYKTSEQQRNELKIKEKAMAVIDFLREQKGRGNCFANTSPSAPELHGGSGTATQVQYLSAGNQFGLHQSSFGVASLAAGAAVQQGTQFAAQQPPVVGFQPAELYQDPNPGFSFSSGGTTSYPQSAQPASSLFSAPLQNSQPIQQQHQQVSQFCQSTFQQAVSSVPVGIAAQVTFTTNQVSEKYSMQNELSEVELNSFQANTFKYRQIPLKPPPKEFC